MKSDILLDIFLQFYSKTFGTLVVGKGRNRKKWLHKYKTRNLLKKFSIPSDRAHAVTQQYASHFSPSLTVLLVFSVNQNISDLEVVIVQNLFEKGMGCDI